MPRGSQRMYGDPALWRVPIPHGTTLAELRRLPGVAHVEPDRLRRRSGGTDPLRGAQTYLRQIAWTPQIGGRRPLVALIDTGVDGRHRDLDGAIAPGARSFVDDEPLVDRSGHGTHLAGLVAAETRNGFGIAGVANVRLLVVKVADAQGRAPSSALIQGVRYAVARGAKVINLSFGGSGYSPAEQRAILDARRAGVLVVAAAGNTGLQGNAVEYPGAYRHVLTVGAVRSDAAAILVSTKGQQVAIAAPGKGIQSTLPRGRFGSRTGTSMATAIVTGVASRLLARRPGLDPSQVRAMLIATASDSGPAGFDVATGWGVVDLAAALVAPPARRDRAEPDDDAALARALPSLLPSGGVGEATATATLEQWADHTDDYRVDLAVGETLTIDATAEGDADLDLVIWKPGAPSFTPGPDYTRRWLAATSLKPGTTETLGYTATQAGEHTVEVVAASGRGPYRLEVRRSAASPPPQ